MAVVTDSIFSIFNISMQPHFLCKLSNISSVPKIMRETLSNFEQNLTSACNACIEAQLSLFEKLYQGRIR
ncbi:hypothetical protein J18TS1_13550 [Oceanobacillus oncorhynchi subsp. incaldanensis]|nr:hypothetical protein J18TS1_13550 [Oceanobacillus oncorhynchi subsp. incaldanensis]